ncbi:hypothetical protein ACFQS1_26205 [Paractinoplanes rhizophilus]|jgi:hypothetical protein|uniref:Uncharacterized protein n=1 Tax=Paractinoplanes rhizophilus TaxID=1416877 RepID=A0ABW2HWG7_9ACTN|nr:hypothetical protein [Actinoplanes sp.]
MFSTSSKAERTAEQAWEYLSSAMSSAGDTATKAASAATDKGQGWADEAWRRASAAADALAGRRPGRPWGTLLLAGLAGVAVGLAAAAYSRRALARQAAEEEQELAQTAVVLTGDR